MDAQATCTSSMQFQEHLGRLRARAVQKRRGVFKGHTFPAASCGGNVSHKDKADLSCRRSALKREREMLTRQRLKDNNLSTGFSKRWETAVSA